MSLSDSSRKRLPKSKIEARVAEMLRWCKLEAFAKRKPHQFSGGQRQRVALARSLAKWPKRPSAGRAARRARQEAAGRDPVRADGTAGAARPHLHHRHARPGGGDDDGRPHRRDGSGQADSGRHSDGNLRAPRTRWVAEFIGEVNLFEGRVADQGARRGRDTATGRVWGSRRCQTATRSGSRCGRRKCDRG